MGDKSRLMEETATIADEEMYKVGLHRTLQLNNPENHKNTEKRFDKTILPAYTPATRRKVFMYMQKLYYQGYLYAMSVTGCFPCAFFK